MEDIFAAIVVLLYWAALYWTVHPSHSQGFIADQMY